MTTPPVTSPITPLMTSPTTLLNRLNVVLHRPIYPRNIGMCARAMANMGTTRLVIVGLQCELNAEARQGAAHAQTVLREATLYRDLTAFLASEGEGFRIALSGREGGLKKQPDSLEDIMAKAVMDPEHPMIRNTTAPIYLMFGAENDGMTNEEMELCHHICHLPTFGEITSLNLSHAVLLALYIVHRSLRDATAIEPPVSVPTMLAPVSTSAKSPLYHPQETIHCWLKALGFDLSAPRVNIEKTLNRILLSRAPTADELRILDAVLRQTVRKLESAGSKDSFKPGP